MAESKKGTITLNAVAIGTCGQDTLFLTRADKDWQVQFYCTPNQAQTAAHHLNSHALMQPKSEIVADGVWRGWTRFTCTIAEPGQALLIANGVQGVTAPALLERTFYYGNPAQVPAVSLTLRTYAYIPRQIAVQVEKQGRLVLRQNDRLLSDIAAFKNSKGKVIFPTSFWQYNWVYFRAEQDLPPNLHDYIVGCFGQYAQGYATSI